MCEKVEEKEEEREEEKENEEDRLEFERINISVRPGLVLFVDVFHQSIFAGFYKNMYEMEMQISKNTNPAMCFMYIIKLEDNGTHKAN